ncbi:hypothetical protein Tsubulata_041368 [Turnera subulata]|uniref:Potassium transporter n=1 Tax=Turnera subulata TaxID=218843 RepID=A0A9Q0FX60_9ROSI|nr:hypothetical protein Tsubulata_041368 [Turnera subulata]
MSTNMDEESGCGVATQESKPKHYKTTLLLAYQSLGVVYGDLCTSPLYVYKATFSGTLSNFAEDHEIFGVLSLVFWTLTIVALFKYAVFVLGADDNGEGGTFALYSLLCRHSKIGLLNSHDSADDNVLLCYCSAASTKETRTSLIIKEFFDKYHSSRVVLLLVVMLGTSMVIGDGILNPSMSDYIVLIACIIIVALFALQHYGTHRVGFLFAPILTAWLLCIAGIGIYNIFYWNPRVVNALSPFYIFAFFKEAGKAGWFSLGGVVLCITGAEAMFADLGHFSRVSIRTAFIGFVYPCMVLAYMGEAAYLSKNKYDLQSSFYKSVPSPVFWPVFLVATLASVVASQAIISAIFSIISQCRALGCFPRVKIVHTSSSIHGQVYIPEVNWMLMLLCLAVIIGFRDISTIGNAYGLAVITMMFVTTLLMFLIITTVWKRSVFMAALFVTIFGTVELSYLGACVSKVHKGGWLPLVVSFLTLSLMSTWHYGTSRKQLFEVENKIELDSLLILEPGMGITRVPGICLVFSDLISGIPPMFAHFVTNFPAFHHVLVFVTRQCLMLPRVPVGDRFHVERIGPPGLCVFRCIARYGYKDVTDSYDFETELIENISKFLKYEWSSRQVAAAMEKSPLGAGDGMDTSRGGVVKKVRFQCLEESDEEVHELMEAKEAGVAYMMSNTCVIAREASSVLKKFVINIVYAFLRRNSRSAATSLGIPHAALIEVGMLYQV